MPETLTVRQVARLLGVSPRTVRHWAQMGRLPGVRLGHRWRFPKPAIDALVAALEQTAPATLPVRPGPYFLPYVPVWAPPPLREP